MVRSRWGRYMESCVLEGLCGAETLWHLYPTLGVLWWTSSMYNKSSLVINHRDLEECLLKEHRYSQGVFLWPRAIALSRNLLEMQILKPLRIPSHNLWGWGPAIYLLKIPPGYSHASYSLSTTIEAWSSLFCLKLCDGFFNSLNKCRKCV